MPPCGQVERRAFYARGATSDSGARFAPNLPLNYPRPPARATPHPTHVSHTFLGQSVAFTISPLSSPPHQLTTSPPHHLTISPPHNLTISISHNPLHRDEESHLHRDECHEHLEPVVVAVISVRVWHASRGLKCSYGPCLKALAYLQADIPHSVYMVPTQERKPHYRISFAGVFTGRPSANTVKTLHRAPRLQGTYGYVFIM